MISGVKIPDSKMAREAASWCDNTNRDVVQPFGSCLLVRSDEGATRHFTSQTHALGFATLLGIAELSGASIRSRPHSALMPALRENQQGFGLLIARNGDWNAASLLRRKTNFTSHFKVIWVVQIGRGKYSAFPLSANRFHTHAIPPHEEGRTRRHDTWSAGCGGRDGVARARHCRAA